MPLAAAADSAAAAGSAVAAAGGFDSASVVDSSIQATSSDLKCRARKTAVFSHYEYNWVWKKKRRRKKKESSVETAYATADKKTNNFPIT